MPAITVNILEGRTIDQKRDLAARLSETAADCLDVSLDSVRLRIVESARTNVARGGTLFADRP